jgi:hypothetical protein
LKLFRTSSTRPPLPAHIANLPRRKACCSMVSSLFYTGTLRQYSSSHSTSNDIPEWSLTPSIRLQEGNKFSGPTKYTSRNASPRVGIFTACVYPLSRANLFRDSCPPVVHSTFLFKSPAIMLRFVKTNQTKQTPWP